MSMFPGGRPYKYWPHPASLNFDGETSALPSGRPMFMAMTHTNENPELFSISFLIQQK
jgi:hypothetical protein